MEKRTVLWYMVFWGFAMNYIIRVNINIAIVAMVKHRTKTTNESTDILVSECFLNTVSSESKNITHAQLVSPADLNDDKFEWDEYQQNAILGVYFMLLMLMQIPGGILAQWYGTKTVFGLSNGVAALLSFAIPASAKINYETLLAVRLIQGMISGATWPSMHSMTAKWIPPHERSQFVSSYLGSSVGAALTYAVGGYLITMFGWESIFYVSGGLGLIWIICWISFVYDSPAEHPTISEREKIYIENCIGDTVQTRSKPLPIPWKSLLLSKPLYINLVAQIGGLWGLLLLTTQSPSYFHLVLGLNIKQTGLWSGLPQFIRWMFSFGFSMICDRLIKSKIMSVTNVRKLATSFCNIFQGLFILGLCLSGCNSMVAVIMVMAATAMHGAVTSGPLTAVVDIAPNYAGVILGIIGTVSVSPGFISPIVVGYFTRNQQTLNQWNKVFYLSAAICISTGLIYILFGTSKIQKWNSYNGPTSNEKEIEQELKSCNELKT